MNCNQAKTHIHDLLDGYLANDWRHQVLHHIKQCQSCSQFLAAEKSLRAELRSLPVPAMPFSTYPMPSATTEKTTNKSIQWFGYGFTSALAASILLFMSGISLLKPTINQTSSVQNITLTLHQPRLVNMVFNAPDDLTDVTFSVKLPEHMELTPFPGQQYVEWKGDLYAGNNLLALPVIAHHTAQGEMTAHLKYNGNVKEFKVSLSTVKQASTASRPITSFVCEHDNETLK